MRLSLPSAFEKRVCFEGVGKSSLCGEWVADERFWIWHCEVLMTEKKLQKKVGQKVVRIKLPLTFALPNETDWLRDWLTSWESSS